ncbi:MAG: hypothetical protein J6J18_03500, partial [Oscillospiraceae bacterium]|nr:hypothetical protein [Oscillospiraceae bacterium]
AVQFYFPGARVRYQMSVDLVGDAGEETTPQSPAVTAPLTRGAESSARRPAGKILDLSDFL